MFSRLATRPVGLVRVFQLETNTSKALLILPARGKLTIQDHVDNWEKANQLYYSKERDYKNFPIEKMPETAPPVRLGFIPESWFQFFYPKTGVTGPYMFGVGVFTYLMSKEIWVAEHGFTEFWSFWLAMFILIKKFGPKVKEWSTARTEGYVQKRWYGPLEQTLASSNEQIAELEKTIWREDGQKHLFEVKRENVDLQLEAAYRQRLETVHQAVKKRLDYQVALMNTKRQLEQQHMVNWIVDNVVKGITPQQEKNSLTKCIADLKVLSQKHAAAM